MKNYANRADKRVFNGNQLDKLYAQITGKENATYKDVEDAAKEIKTSEDFQSTSNTQTKGALITLTIDNMVWNAVYLSTNKSEYGEDPILTLWLADTSDIAQYNTYNTNANGKYPANLYGTSKIRTETLNNSGTYYESKDGDSPHTVDSTLYVNHKYAKFTIDSVDGSLTKFIDEPVKVAWQATERSSLVNPYLLDFNNDAYEPIGDYTMHSGMNYAVDIVDITKEERLQDLTAWKNDKIWLPSMAESGMNGAGGIWKTSSAQRATSNGLRTWMRSADNSHYDFVHVHRADGSRDDYPTVDVTCSVRPAFHLNLAKAEKASARSLQMPQDVELPYTGDEQGVESKYTQDFLDSVDIKYYDEGSTTPRSTKPTTVGNYTVKYTLKDGYYWADNLDGVDRTKSFTITPRKLDYPTFDNGKYSIQKSYAGDEEISFTLDNFDKKYIEVTYSGADNGVSYDGTYSEALAKYVGKYYLDVKIKDEYGSNCVFKDTPTNGKLEFEVVKATVGMEILDGSSSSIVGIRGSKKKVMLNIPDAQKKVHAGKRIYVQVVAKDEFEEYVLSGNVEIDGSKLQYSERELNVGRLRKGTYDLEIKVVDGLDGASYTASVVNGAKLEVKEVEPGTQLIWQLYSGRDTDGSFVAANIGD
ncbi:MAG: hypothetical protein K2N32_05535, partial [Clostridia bacterium]|nr:hypothetical protein [Clostridia bacterium]